MRLEQVRLSEDAAQARRLQTLLAFKEQFISKTVAAQVIGSSGSDLSRTVYIDKGENAGISRDMAVITADGIVGKVLVAYPSVSQVLLVSDQSSGVGAILEKTRLQGVLRGTANGEVVLERVMSDEQVPVGETVLTSGGDQIFPKGLPVGTVSKVGSGKDLFLNIKIKPASDLSKLEEVLVLVEKQDRQSTAEDKSRVRAADILAQRLPSVPDKPAADANAVGSTPASPAKAATASTALKPAGATAASAVPTVKNAPTAVKVRPALTPAPTGAPADQPSTIEKAAPSAAQTKPKPEAAAKKPAITETQPEPPPPNSQPPAVETSPN